MQKNFIKHNSGGKISYLSKAKVINSFLYFNFIIFCLVFIIPSSTSQRRIKSKKEREMEVKNEKETDEERDKKRKYKLLFGVKVVAVNSHRLSRKDRTIRPTILGHKCIIQMYALLFNCVSYSTSKRK